MLPKIEKNLFKDSVKQASKKVFNPKMFIASVLLIGAAATANSNLPNTTILDNMTKVQKQDNLFVLKPSETAAQTYAWHYSHTSHYSHGSHYSHYSSSIF